LSTQWLTDVFVPTVEETLGSFTQICAATKTAVDAQWSAIVEGMRGLPDTHFERATISPSGEPEIHVDWAPVDLGGSGGEAAVRDAEQARTRASHRSFEITREGLAAARDAEAEPAPVKPKPAPPSDEEEFGGSFLVESFDTRAMRPPRPPGARAESSVEVDQG